MIVTLIVYYPDGQYTCFKDVRIDAETDGEQAILTVAREHVRPIDELLAVRWGNDARSARVHLVQNGQTYSGRIVHQFLRQTYKQDWMTAHAQAPDLVALMQEVRE